MRRLPAVATAISILIIIAACVSSDPNAPKTSTQDTIRKGVIAFHDGMYTPTMIELAARRDRGDRWVVQNTLKIQSLSETYVRLKDEIDEALRTWDFVSSPATVNAKMQAALKIIEQLQDIEARR